MIVMEFWYDILTDDNGNEKLVMFPNGVTPKPADFEGVYPVPWGVQGFVYFNTKLGAVMVNSHLGTLEGCTVNVSIR